MNPFALILGFFLLVGSVFYVAAPFRWDEKKFKAKKQTGPSITTQDDSHQADILALRDLDFDYRAGKISEEDYGNLRTALLSRAATSLQIMDETSDARLEKLIQARRKQQSSTSDSAETRNNSSGSLTCANCQSPLAVGANFCMKCGTAVSRAFCPHCGNPTQPDDQFCPACGKATSNQSHP
jgi:hypothetical protein